MKGSVDRVQIVLKDTVVATHPRSYEAGDQVLDPLHYLITLGRRPAALDRANVYRGWKLPRVFEELRARLETQHGIRQYVRGCSFWRRTRWSASGGPSNSCAAPTEPMRSASSAAWNARPNLRGRMRRHLRRRPRRGRT